MKNIFIRWEFLKTKNSKYLFAGLGMLSGLNAMAQNNEASQNISSLSLFANPLFDVLLGVIIILILLIAVLAGVFKNVATATVDEKTNNNSKIIGIVAFILFIGSNIKVVAQSATETSTTATYVELPDGLMYLMLCIIAFEFLILGMLINGIKMFTTKKLDENIILKEEPSFFEVINASVALENEGDILLDHNYDGIRELDNDLPPWWKYGFYLTVCIAIAYLFNYHVIGGGLLQVAEYNKSIQMAALAKEEYQKMNANNVNESSVTMLTDKAEIAKGESIFKENCFACHGKLGEGGVGPNLTDEYWLHGGSIKDIFKSIKYGWPDKGMKSWEADFSPVQIHEISSYIKTLKGTSPVNAKAPQGDLYTEILVAVDSLKTDSLANISKIDSLKIVTK
jgi:cytochrome c oxidase cbb3-type subunit III